MTGYRISYPITQQVQAARRRFKLIDQRARIPKKGRSELEIVRLLDNVHYPHIEQLLELINSTLPQCGPIGTRLVCQTNPFQLGGCLAELFLFAHLRRSLGDSVRAVATEPSQKGADIEASLDDLSVRLEVYSPIDLMGFQIIERQLGAIFKYLEVDRGFRLHLALCSSHDDATSAFYPLLIPGESQVVRWLEHFSEKAHAWLNGNCLMVGDSVRIEGPGRNLFIEARLETVEDDPTNREITFVCATHSTDSRLLFECRSPEEIAKSSWGQKIKTKLEKKQAGPSGLNNLRILVIDFARANTASPDFICWPKIASKLEGTVSILAKGIHTPPSYDVLLPARLDFNCCFSLPIWIDESKARQGKLFIQKLQLNRPCVEVVQDQIPVINSLLQDAARE